MRYVVWTKGPILMLLSNLASLASEVDSSGYVHREIGFDAAGAVIHKKPSESHQRGDYGLLDGPPIDVDIAIARGIAREIPPTEFDQAWNQSP